MSRHCAMLVSSSQAGPVIPAAGEDGKGSAEDRLRADLARRVVAGPGLWTDWLEDIDRRGLIEELLADGVIEEAAASAPHDHQLDRALNAKMTVICLIVGCLFPGEGYDGALRVAFSLPGLGIKPGTPVPSGPALSKARALSGEHVMKRLFELDAARPDPEPGPGSLWHQMELTAIDGTTAELFSNDELADEFGVPSGGTKPKLRIVAHVRTGTRRWIGAAVGGYLDGENTVADELAGTFRPGMLNLADRGFFSMSRWIRLSATGAHLCWRVKNGAASVPFKTLRVLPDGSELVRLHESDGMLSTRRCAQRDRHPPVTGCGGVGPVLLRGAELRADADNSRQVQHFPFPRARVGAAGGGHGGVGDVPVRPQGADDHGRVRGVQQRPHNATGQPVLAVQVALQLIQPYHRPRGWRLGQRGDFGRSVRVYQPPVRQQRLHGLDRTPALPDRGPAD